MTSSFLFHAWIVVHALVSLLFGVFVLLREQDEPIRTVAQAAAVMLLWPIQATIFVVTEFMEYIQLWRGDDGNEE